MKGAWKIVNLLCDKWEVNLTEKNEVNLLSFYNVILILIYNMNFFQDGNTALHLAASSGHAVLVEKLINCGAQKDITNKVSSYMVCTIL